MIGELSEPTTKLAPSPPFFLPFLPSQLPVVTTIPPPQFARGPCPRRFSGVALASLLVTCFAILVAVIKRLFDWFALSAADEWTKNDSFDGVGGGSVDGGAPSGGCCVG